MRRISTRRAGVRNGVELTTSLAQGGDAAGLTGIERENLTNRHLLGAIVYNIRR